MLVYTCMHICPHIHAIHIHSVYTCTCRYTYMLAHMCMHNTHRHIYLHTHVCTTHIHEQTGTHKHTYPYANVCMYTCKFTHMHAYMYTHTVIVIMCQLYKNMFGELVKYYCWVCL